LNINSEYFSEYCNEETADDLFVSLKNSDLLPICISHDSQDSYVVSVL